MYRDFITYHLNDGKSSTYLLEIAQQIYEQWMKHQPGFIDWQIHENSDGSYTDVVTWESKDAAKQAEGDMINIKDAHLWFGCYKEGSIISSNSIRIGNFVSQH